jgi:hypothetical protein
VVAASLNQHYQRHFDRLFAHAAAGE